MKMPWISRSYHETMVGLVADQVAELKAERKILLDRLAILGLGGPLYHTTTELLAEDTQEAQQETEESGDDAEEVLERFMRLRRRPARLADALTRAARRDRNKRPSGPKVAWIAQADAEVKNAVKTALDQAEELGRQQAG